MHEKRIVAAMIAGGASLSGEHLKKCVESTAPFVDAIYIAYNGSGPFLLDAEFLKSHKTEVRYFPWEQDFGLARNQSFAMALESRPDWILWIDADDVLVDGPKLRPMIDSLTDDVVAVFLRYDYLVDEDGKPLIQQWRERLMSTKTDWRWDWPIHEVCHSRPGEHYTRREDCRIVHQKTGSEEMGDTRSRNRSILKKALGEYPDEPRFLYYAANETLAEAQAMSPSPERDDNLRLAIEYYKQFIDKTPWNDDAYLANSNMAESFRTLGEQNLAINSDLQGIKLYPTWPHAYIGIANSCLKLGDLEKAGWWAQLCMDKCSPPDTTQVYEPRLLTFHPYLLRGISREHARDLDGAIDDFRTALLADPDNEVVKEKIAQVEEMKRVFEAGAQQYDDGGELWKQQRKLYFGSSPEKSVAFLTSPLFEPWQPSTESEHGAGGAETCIMRLAPRFLRDGYRAVVFGTPAIPGVELDGVEYYPVQDWDPSEKFSTVVVSRAPDFLDARIQADQVFFWMHDVNGGPALMTGEWGDRFARVTKIVGLTSWHVEHVSRLYGIHPDRFAVVPNGIELGLYDEWDKIEKSPNRFVWSSSPDRGLDVVLGLWPEIRNILPEAELHIFYGWAAIDRIIGAGGSDKRSHLGHFKAEIEMALDALGREKAGIYWHDRVSQKELSLQQMRSSYWIYPTSFCETFCITALEAQAAGMVPLTSNLAALKETVLHASLRLDGWPNNVSYQEEFLRLVERVKRMDPFEKADMVESARKFAEGFSWDHAYQAWRRLIEAGR